MYLVETKSGGEDIGICGLLRRAGRDEVEIGFAFLAAHCGHGFGYESAVVILEQAGRLGLKRIDAITHPENLASIRLLEKLGFRREGRVRASEGEAETLLFVWGDGEDEGVGER